jgi:hypothetical protein
VVDVGGKLHEYIQQIARAGATCSMESANNIQNNDKLAMMEAEIKKMTTTMAAMATIIGKKENRNPNCNAKLDGSKDQESPRPQTKKLRNIGDYCHSHGFCPVGVQKTGHKSALTWANWLGGDMFWPTIKQLATEQH